MIGTKLGESGTLRVGDHFMVKNWAAETLETASLWGLFQVQEIRDGEIVAIDHSDGRRNRFWLDEDAQELIHVLAPAEAEILRSFALNHMLRQLAVVRDRVEGVAV